jgi:hypothetical protein
MLNFRELDFARAMRINPLTMGLAILGKVLQTATATFSQHKSRGFTYVKRNPLEEQWATQLGHIASAEHDSGCKDFFISEMHKEHN